MNEQTIALLRDLAAKFGTTSEHLWGVLIKQAPISAVTDFLCAGFGILVFSPMLYFGIKSCRKDNPEAGIPLIFMGWIGAIICAICFLCSIGDVTTAFLNPEYWALDKIMSIGHGCKK